MIPSPPSPLRLYSSLPSPLSTALAAHSPSLSFCSYYRRCCIPISAEPSRRPWSTAASPARRSDLIVAAAQISNFPAQFSYLASADSSFLICEAKSCHTTTDSLFYHFRSQHWRRKSLQIFPESSPLHLAARGGSLDCVRELLAWEQIDRKEILLG
ncbi:hypothetical protein Scep_027266 [Stephania cephalantha]|uniref:Uncharacterized protein n=1 Tax=Stephania cephalantha TaxID=152367 RepID=A0AAP0HID2_9MAGN